MMLVYMPALDIRVWLGQDIRVWLGEEREREAEATRLTRSRQWINNLVQSQAQQQQQQQQQTGQWRGDEERDKDGK